MAIYKLFDDEEKDKVTILMNGEDEPSEEMKLRATKVRGAFLIRCFLFFLAFVFLILLCFSVAIFVVSGALSVVTLFQVEQFPFIASRFWRDLRMYTALFVGAAIGLVSPNMGIGFMLLYFLFIPENARPGSFSYTLRQALKAVLSNRL